MNKWVAGARPRTLPAAIVPVAVGTAAAVGRVPGGLIWWRAGAALAGFVAIDAAQRPAFRTGLPLLVSSQVEMLFGLGAADGAVHLHDWAAEPFTCTDADRAESLAPVPPPEPADARLQAPLWDGRLWLGGSETATHGTGLLEGALGAAARLRRALTGRP